MRSRLVCAPVRSAAGMRREIMIERILLYPAHIAELLRVRGGIHSVVATLDAVRLPSKEPVPFEEAASSDMQKTRKGQVWGGLYDCCWFRFRGRVPESAKGRHTVLIIDTGGEGLARDMTKGGAPMQGLTNILSPIDAVQSVCGKRIVEFLPCAEGGEAVDIMVDAGNNDVYRVHPARFARAAVAVRDDALFRYYYDFLVLFQLLLTYGKNENLSDPDAVELNKVLTRAERLRRKDLGAATELLEARLGTPNVKAVTEYTAVGHAHLDLAWLWPLRETKRKAARTFATALKNTELYPDYVFGASQAQQFEWMEKEQPEIFGRLGKAVADGRVEIQGGMWTESDCNLPSGESLIRQFAYGDEYFGEKFGVHTDMVWLPDVFGFPASLPQIMKKCGKEYFMTIKLSWNEHNKFPYKTFRWQGIDGTEIVSHMPPQGDYNSSGCPLAVVKSDGKFDQSKDFDTALIAYGVGDGGGGPGEGHIECVTRERDIKGLSKVKTGAARDFLVALEAVRDKMPVHKGELYLEKHQGTYTSQGRNKRYNRLLERALHNYEWLAAAATVKGIPYDRETLDAVWKEVLLYQFHDVIPGSSIGRVYKETTEGYERMLAVLRRASDDLLVALGAEKGKGLFNGAPFAVDGAVKSGGRWYRARAAAYSAVVAEEISGDAEGLVAGERSISNGILTVTTGRDGVIRSLTDGEGREYAGEYLNRLTVYSDPRMHYNAWDININYPRMRKKQLRARSVKSYIDGCAAVLEILYEGDRYSVTQKLSLVKGEDMLRVDTFADWHERHKMLRADFRPMVWSDTVECDIQFGTVRRSTGNKTKIEKAQFEICAHKYVALEKDGFGFAVLNDCKYGHRVKEGKISLNLLRSPKYPDPGCDMGRHTFSYAVCPYRGSAESAGVVGKAYLLNNPPEVRDLAAEIAPLVTADSDGVVVETVKPARDAKGVVARVYERYGKECACTLGATFAAKGIYETDMLEKWRVESDGRTVFKPFEIKTIYFEI